MIKILIVEDNLFLQKTLEEKLANFLDIVIKDTTQNGEEAIAILEKNHVIDLILMDIQMPIMNGYETTLEIRKLNQNIKTPIIALTAGIMLGEKEKCIESGMNDYISKPIIEGEVEAKLKK